MRTHPNEYAYQKKELLITDARRAGILQTEITEILAQSLVDQFEEYSEGDVVEQAATDQGRSAQRALC